MPRIVADMPESCQYHLGTCSIPKRNRRYGTCSSRFRRVGAAPQVSKSTVRRRLGPQKLRQRFRLTTGPARRGRYRGHQAFPILVAVAVGDDHCSLSNTHRHEEHRSSNSFAHCSVRFGAYVPPMILGMSRVKPCSSGFSTRNQFRCGIVLSEIGIGLAGGRRPKITRLTV